jgi:hypothetical protein
LKATADVVRRGLLYVLLIGLVGMEAELLLLKHIDGVWQLVPVVLIAVALLVLAFYAVTRGAGSIRALQLVMALFVASGVVGAIQHFRGNVVYERDSNPSLSGLELYKSAMMGSTPALAPGAMIQLGLIGLLFTYRHPSLGRAKANEDQSAKRNGI